MAYAPYVFVNPWAWPWERPVLSAGNAVLALRTRLWPPPSSRQVFRLCAVGSLTVPNMPCSLTTQLIHLHWQQDARLAHQAPDAANARWHPPQVLPNYSIDPAYAALFIIPPACRWDACTP
jgi:hypothetical protein